MDSFYGGKQGLSFVLRGSFKYINLNKDNPTDGAPVDPHCPYTKNSDGKYVDKNGTVITDNETIAKIKAEVMSESFMDPEYKDVWYGEYAIIDTVNKNNENNGKIFRRTLKNFGSKEVEGRCAEYVGQIVGPAGLPPKVFFGSTKVVESRFDGFQATKDDDELQAYVDGVDKDGNKIAQEIHKYPEDVDPDNFNLYLFDGQKDSFFKDPYPEGITTETTQVNLEKADESIKYNWYSYRRSDESFAEQEDSNEIKNPTEIGMGFSIPSFKTKMFSKPYDYNKIPDMEDISSPKGFVHKITFNLPRGIQGAGVYNLKIKTIDDLYKTGKNNTKVKKITNIWDFTDPNTKIEYIDPSSQGEFTGYQIADGSKEWNQPEWTDDTKDNTYWFYEFVWYSTYTLESWDTAKWGEQIQVSKNPTEKGYYSIYQNTIYGYLGDDTRIAGIEVDPSKGISLVVYKSGDREDAEGNLHLPKSMSVNTVGEVTVHLTYDKDENGNPIEPSSYKFKEEGTAKDFRLTRIEKTFVTNEETEDKDGNLIGPYHLLIKFNNPDIIPEEERVIIKEGNKEIIYWDAGCMRGLDHATLPMSGKLLDDVTGDPYILIPGANPESKIQDAIDLLNDKYPRGYVDEYAIKKDINGKIVYDGDQPEYEKTTMINHILGVDIMDTLNNNEIETHFFAYNFFDDPQSDDPIGWQYIGKISQPLLATMWTKITTYSDIPVLANKNIGRIKFVKD